MRKWAAAVIVIFFCLVPQRLVEATHELADTDDEYDTIAHGAIKDDAKELEGDTNDRTGNAFDSPTYQGSDAAPGVLHDGVHITIDAGSPSDTSESETRMPQPSEIEQSTVSQQGNAEQDVKPRRKLYGPGIPYTTTLYLVITIYSVEATAFLTIFWVFIQIYFGRQKNTKVALSWLETAKPFMASQFTSIGHSGSYMQSPCWHTFELYATGRVLCKSCTCVIECIPRQCIWTSNIMSFVFMKKDKLTISIPMQSMEMGIVAVGRRAELKKLKNLSIYLKDGAILRKVTDDIPSSLCVLADNSEIFDKIFNSEIIRLLTPLEKYLQNIIISDEIPLPFYNDEKIGIQATFTLPPINEMDEAKSFIRLVVGHLIDIAGSNKVSDKAKQELRKQRALVEKKLIRQNEVEREEEIATKRAEKKAREDEQKEKMTPEEQRRLEEKEYKRSLKQKGLKMKVRRS